jgi:hypothetical protein
MNVVAARRVNGLAPAAGEFDPGSGGITLHAE